MSSLVKNQIAKQLARFTKNFSPNKISVKFLKGEGELHNLELDEKIISDLLELPPWLRITKAVCNKISTKIHWTKLKTDPICLYLDCVEIDMEEVILAQTKSTSTPQPRLPPPQVKEKQANRYGFVEKVVDGMFVQMNSVIISFKSLQFQASVQISRLITQSTTPEWTPDDLRNTRIKDEGKGEVLTFKEIHWSTLRIDANAIVPENCKDKSSPIRLITSHSSLHITIKKKLEDCSVASACLELLLDDILWVLTQSQLQALVNFMNSINKAVEQLGTKKEPVANGTAPGQTPQHQTPTQYTSSNLQNKTDPDNQVSDFSKYDLLETSYHLRTGRIDLHLCDDSNEKDKANSADTLAGGAMQININKLAIDNYPYHLAGTSRTKWVCHNEASLTRAYWVNQLLNTFRNNVKSRKVTSPEGMETRTTRSKAEGTCSTDSPSHQPSSPARHHHPPPSPNPSHTSTPLSPQQQRIGQTQNQRRPVFMYENCYLIRCEEFVIMPVTTYNAPNEGVAFLSSDKKALYLPTDMPAFQIDYTQYYYPTGIPSPVPSPNLFVQMNPVQLTLDTTTCIWFNRFLRTIFSVRDPCSGLQAQQPSHVDIRIEALMPKIILPCPSEPGCHYRESRPQALQIQMSQVALTNSRVGSNSSQTELLMLLQQFSLSKLYTDYNNFPNNVNDIRPLSNLAWLKDFGVVEDPIRIERLLNGLRNDSSSTCSPSQVWCLTADQCWADFLGITNNKNRPLPFIEALPLRLWVCTPIPNHTPEVIPPPCPSRPGEHHKIPQPSSTASSPGCVRSHLNVQPSSAVHISNSSPNLKDGTKKTLDPNRANDVNSRKTPPVSSSLPASPNLRDNTGLRQDDGAGSKSFRVASLSNNSQSLSSLSQEELNGGVDSSSGKRNGAEVLDRTFPNGLSNDKVHATNTGNPKESSVDTNKGSGLPGHDHDGGSSRTKEKAPNLRKAFGSYSSTEEDNLSDYPLEAPKVADMSVLAVIPANFTAQFDHFQYIFLLRLQESLIKMQAQLDSEAKKHLGKSGSTSDAPSHNVTFSLLAKRGEVSIVLPPGPELSNSRGTSSASSYIDPGFVSDGDTGLPDVGTDGLDIRNKSPHSKPDIISPLPKEDHSVPLLNIQSKSSRGDLLPVIDGTTSGADHTGRGSTSPMCDSTTGWVLQDGDKGVARPRRGSDASCCSSQLGTSVESSARSSARSLRSGRIVSIFSAEGSDLHLGIHMEGADTTVKVTLQDLQIDEKGNHNFEKYLNQKSFKTPQESSTMVPHPLPTTPPMVCALAEFGPGAERNTPSAGERGFAHALLDNVSLSLMMSNMESLSECFDDEILLPRMPFYVELKSSSLCIRDDKPPRLLSIPPPLPVNVNLENISIFRNQDAVIYIKALNPPPGMRGTEGFPVEAEEQFRGDFNQSLSRLSRTTSDLSLAESMSSRSDYDSERECMKAQLSVSRAALHAVQDERQALLKTIERLHYELAMSNREQDRLQVKVIAYQGGGTAARRKTHN